VRVLSAGRFAREAAASGPGVVCAVFQRCFYLRYPRGYACVGHRSLGNGPLNILVDHLARGADASSHPLAMEAADAWAPSRRPLAIVPLGDADPPAEGLGGLLVGRRDSLAERAQPALAALDRWLGGASLDAAAEQLIGLGPGLTPSGDDYFAGMLVALRAAGSGAQAELLWRWLQPRLADRTSALSAAYLAAAAAGEAHEALHDCLGGAGESRARLARLAAVGHCSGWDALAGARAVARRA